MILIGLGSNVSGPWGSPQETVTKAIAELDKEPCSLVRASSLIVTAPFGKTDQPDFINAVAIITTTLAPQRLMAHLHEIELSADRRRTVRWGPRTLDLDLLDYDGMILKGDGPGVGHVRPMVLPHPGIAERQFVLDSIVEVAPDWVNVANGKTAAQMLSALAG